MKKLLIFATLLTHFSTEAISLRFIGDQVINSGEIVKETELGGLSGLFYDQKEKSLLAISDDRSQKNPARFYEFDVKISDSKIEFTPKKVIFLKNSDKKLFEKRTIDFEGITLVNDTVYVSSEGDMNRTPSINPELYAFDRAGNFKEKLPIPEKFLLNPEKTDSRGVRNNLGFEVLASSPDGKQIFLGNEEALLQDGSITTPSYASRTRLIIYEDRQPKFEYVYELDKIQAEPVAGLVAGETGIVDILPFDQKSFLSLERSYLPLSKKTIVKIYNCQITSETTNVRDFESLKNQKVNVIDKTLLLNLDDIITKLSKNHPMLDNIEGITLGPKLPNGNNTLILVSDNNFNLVQKTVFYVFELLP